MDSEKHGDFLESGGDSSPDFSGEENSSAIAVQSHSGKKNKITKLSKEQRKAQKRNAKAEQRAKRAGDVPTATAGSSLGSNPCSQCGRSVDLLVRCQHAGSDEKWTMLCGKCWKKASGGVADGDAEHPQYRYGGLWKNRKPNSKAQFGGRPPALSVGAVDNNTISGTNQEDNELFISHQP